jgi:NAD(P)-dependent dehydrogenase (short-subunit alcohol dehydrogenase family)
MSLTQWNETLTTNLTGSFLVIRQFLARLSKIKEEQGGDSEWMRNVAVVLIGSTGMSVSLISAQHSSWPHLFLDPPPAGEFGEAGHADYAASKSALTHGLQLSLKNEIVKLHPRARVNTVAPGWVRTKMAEESMKDERIKYQALATYVPFFGSALLQLYVRMRLT